MLTSGAIVAGWYDAAMHDPKRDPFYEGLWADVQEGIDAADRGDLLDGEDVFAELLGERRRLYHATSARGAAVIMAEGFRDATGSYGLTGIELTGAFFADRPLDENEGAAASEAVIVVDVAPGVLPTLADHELVEEGKPYREWCLPAALVNAWPRRVLTPDGLDEDSPRRF